MAHRGRSLRGVMGVGAYNVNPSISQHALGPMFRTGSENAQYGAGPPVQKTGSLRQKSCRVSFDITSQACPLTMEETCNEP